jgi:hypothetical protein
VETYSGSGPGQFNQQITANVIMTIVNTLCRQGLHAAGGGKRQQYPELRDR